MESLKLNLFSARHLRQQNKNKIRRQNNVARLLQYLEDSDKYVILPPKKKNMMSDFKLKNHISIS